MYSKSIATIVLVSTSILVVIGCGGGGNSTQSTVADQITSSLSIQDSDNQDKTLLSSNAPKINIGCIESTQDYKVITGSFSVDSTSCGTLILSTNAAIGSYSEGVIEFNQDIALPAFVSVTMERSTGDTNRPLELKVIGAYIGVTPQNGELWYYVYESEAHWTGWINSGIPSGNDIAISARQDGKRISTWLNSVRLPDFTLDVLSSDKRFWLKLKGDSGKNSIALARNFTVLTESVAQEAGISPIATSALTVAPSTTIINLATQPDFANEPWIHRLSIRNDSLANISTPEIVAIPGGLSRVRNAIHPQTCDKLSQLAPGQECSLFVVNGEIGQSSSTQQVNGMAKSLAVNAAISTTTKNLVIQTGSTYQVAKASVPVKPAALPKGYVTSISPLVVKQGIRQDFLISGFGLPDTLTLDLAGQTCLNNAKVLYNKVSCDMNFGRSAAVVVKDKPLGNSYVLPVLSRTVLLSPLDYKWPLDKKFNEVCWDVAQKNPRRSWHTGLDIYAPKGVPVFPIAPGKVLVNNTGSGYGVDSKFLLVDHGGLYAYYGHISSPLRVGDSVFIGQQLGSIVEYTPSKETHLHFSLSNSFAGTTNWGYRSTQSSVLADFESVRPYFGNPTLISKC
jgi:murein DD-endopeptidase MepM/ murein hydrolase activator NlpD